MSQGRQEGGEDIPVWKVVFNQTGKTIFLPGRSYWRLPIYKDEDYHKNTSVTVSLASPLWYKFNPVKLFIFTVDGEKNPDGSISFTVPGDD